VPQTYYLELIRILKNAGFIHITGGKGSHKKWDCRDRGVTVIVPHNLTKRHTTNAVLKQAGLPKAF
jgi:predicted RNA binding protein YcfA (HicA-like mRNA interferase family)